MSRLAFPILLPSNMEVQSHIGRLHYPYACLEYLPLPFKVAQPFVGILVTCLTFGQDGQAGAEAGSSSLQLPPPPLILNMVCTSSDRRTALALRQKSVVAIRRRDLESNMDGTLKQLSLFLTSLTIGW